MSKSKRAVFGIYLMLSLGTLSLVIVRVSDLGSWARGFFMGFMTTAFLGLPYFIYLYRKEVKAEKALIERKFSHNRVVIRWVKVLVLPSVDSELL